MIWTAKWICLGVTASGTVEWLEDGGLELRRGRVVRLLGGRAAVRRAERREGRGARRLGVDQGGALLPGLVCAHAHLELSGIHAERLPWRAGDSFAEWIRALLAQRGPRGLRALQRDAVAGARLLAAGGTTCIGDIDSSGAGALALASAGPRGVCYRELLDAADPARTAPALTSLRRALPRRSRRLEGISAHAPYTCSPALLAGVARLRERRAMPLAVHWAETEEERPYLLQNEGPLAGMLPEGPGRAGLALLAQAGLLGPRTALIHANHPARGEVAVVAASGSSVVHCPGTHEFFGREPFPLARWRRAGVPVALGTDSRASNTALDMCREMRLARAAWPGLAPSEVFAMATSAGARALGLAGLVGALTPGAWADASWHVLDAESPRAMIEEVSAGRGRVQGTWVSGRALSPARPPSAHAGRSVE